MVLAHRFDTWTPRQLVDLATAGKPMEFAPGAAQHYGNIDYLVLGLVIEAVTGRPYGEAIRDGIIRPLHLAATTVPGTGGATTTAWAPRRTCPAGSSTR